MSCIGLNPACCTSETRIKLCVAAVGTVLLIAGVWNLVGPSLSQNHAAGWALIGTGSLFVLGALLKSIKWPCEKKPKAKNLISNIPSVQSVPLDIWKIIFSYLDAGALGRCIRTCSAFYNIIENNVNLWQTLGEKHHISPLSTAKYSKKSLVRHFKFKKALEAQKLNRGSWLPSSCFAYGGNFLYLGSETEIVVARKNPSLPGTWQQSKRIKCQAVSLAYKYDFLFAKSLTQRLEILKCSNSGELKQIQTIHSLVKSFLFEDSTLFCSTDGGCEIWEWSCEKSLFVQIQTLPLTESVPFDNLTCDKNNHLLFSVTKTSINVWKKEQHMWKHLSRDVIEPVIVTSVFFEDGRLFLGTFLGKIISLKWNKESNKFSHHQTLEEKDDVITSLFFTDGILFCGFRDGEMHFWKWDGKSQTFGSKRQITLLEKVDIEELTYADGTLFAQTSFEKKLFTWQS